MKKTQSILDILKYTDELDMSSQELERLIEELWDMQEQKELEEWQNNIDDEEDKNNSLDQLNYK